MKPMELAVIVALTDAGKHASRLENQTSASPISALRSSFLPGEGAKRGGASLLKERRIKGVRLINKKGSEDSNPRPLFGQPKLI